MVDAERPTGLALGLEVRELLDRDAELLTKRRSDDQVGVAGDAVGGRARGREPAEQLVVEVELVGKTGLKANG